jgi:hypothetical protein
VTASTDSTKESATDSLSAGNARIREAAKWLTASSAAVGAALIAGSQLSDIGKLDVCSPDTVECARLWVALFGAVVGLAAVVFAIWTAVQVLLPVTVTLKDLKEWWEGPPQLETTRTDLNLTPVVTFFKNNTKYLQDFQSPEELETARSQAVERLRGLNEKDEGYKEAYDTVVDLDTRIAAIEDMAVHKALETEFRMVLKKLLGATVLVATGIVAFSWAANPPDEPAQRKSQEFSPYQSQPSRCRAQECQTRQCRFDGSRLDWC